MRKKTLIFSLLLSLLVWMLGISTTEAASLTVMKDTMTRHKISTASSHEIKFTTPTGAGDNTDTIIITFPADFNFTSKTIGTVTFTHGATTGAENTETLAATPSATAWGAVFSGTQNRVLTLTAPTDGIGAAVVAASDKVIITYDNTNSINPSSTGSKIISISGTFGDTGSLAVPINSDDQVVVSAAIDPAITFTISASTVDLGTMTTSAVATASPAITLTAVTNAGSGYTIYIQDIGSGSADGLFKSSTPTDLIDSAAATLVATTEGYGVSAQSGTGTVASAYNYTNGSNQVGALSLTTTAFASNSGPTASDTYTVQTKAAIASTTYAGTYADTHTYTITATF